MFNVLSFAASSDAVTDRRLRSKEVCPLQSGEARLDVILLAVLSTIPSIWPCLKTSEHSRSIAGREPVKYCLNSTTLSSLQRSSFLSATTTQCTCTSLVLPDFSQTAATTPHTDWSGHWEQMHPWALTACVVSLDSNLLAAASSCSILLFKRAMPKCSELSRLSNCIDRPSVEIVRGFACMSAGFSLLPINPFILLCSKTSEHCRSITGREQVV
eukprot:TRINITY_DN9832_c1_g1_i7.p1 TRINITY_DN9832_c1_g1~~TRINITY_DN9832_c1_g1_i7.p1  ORF type:complete len:228 (+),score=32.45 TRINITY_DN9832_c1_g1_i7:45-686(+)